MKRRVAIVLAIGLPILMFEIGNLTGFSWERLKYMSTAAVVDAAIRLRYPDRLTNRGTQFFSVADGARSPSRVDG